MDLLPPRLWLDVVWVGCHPAFMSPPPTPPSEPTLAPHTPTPPRRNPQKVTQTLDSISAATSSSRLQGYTADLSSLAEVRRLARAVAADHPQLDVLVNNAGVYQQRME